MAERGAIRGGLLHLDCAAGIAGDMAVGALVDLGVPESVVRDALAALPLDGYRVRFSRVRRGALMGTRFAVEVDAASGGGHHGHQGGAAASPHHHPEQPAAASGHAHRHYAAIRSLIEGSALAGPVRARAVAIFDHIAAVEARLHGVTVDAVAFHEVGAVDSIVDIVATAAALDFLAPLRVTAGTVPLGHGTIDTAHGRLPLPSPATLELLAGAPVEDGGSPFELTTPTGAAILAASVQAFGTLPAMEVAAVGWGAGSRELPDRPNLLRAIVGRPLDHSGVAPGELCLVIEANLDDMSPELLAPLIGDLLAAGARDAWVTATVMKKGRPGWVVSALCDPPARAAVEQAFFAGSSTIGVRRHPVERTVLPRRVVEVQTPFGAVRVKVSGSGPSENAAPEMDDCARLAAAHGVPRRRVHAEALAAWLRDR
jgi:uncharacterized protein (TIGR00299 family) protein